MLERILMTWTCLSIPYRQLISVIFPYNNIIPASRRRWRAKFKPRIEREIRPSGRNLPRWCGVTVCNNTFGRRRCPPNPECKICILFNVVIYPSQTWHLLLNLRDCSSLFEAHIYGKDLHTPHLRVVFVLASSHDARYGA